MWRRLPLLPMLFGAFAGWALLSMLASRERALSEGRVYVVTGAFCAAFALLVNLLLRGLRRPQSTLGSIGHGCLYAWIGMFFVAVVAVMPVVITGRGVNFYGIGPSLMAITAFCGLGILGGVMLARFRRAEAERQAAALEAQRAAFATEQLELARDLQQRLLPPPLLEGDSFRVSARNAPAAYVAGDFFDFVPLAGGRMLIVIADVAGKGVAAGLIMATVKAILPLLAAEEPAAAALLGRVNDRLALRGSRRDFVALIAAIYEPRTGELSLANAALPDPLLVSAAASPRPLVVSGPRYPAGIRSPLAYEALTVHLAPGDRVVFFTDGLPEASVDGAQFGYERFTSEVQRARGDLAALFDALDKLSAGHDDDWTAVVLERLA